MSGITGSGNPSQMLQQLQQIQQQAAQADQAQGAGQGNFADERGSEPMSEKRSKQINTNEAKHNNRKLTEKYEQTRQPN